MLLVEEIMVQGGHDPKKTKWALSNWTPRPAYNAKEKSRLEMGCNYCTWVQLRRAPNTVYDLCLPTYNRNFELPHVLLVVQSTKTKQKKSPASSNFISHSLVCSSLPDSQSWAVYEARKGGRGDQSGATLALGTQRSFMQDFGQRGLDNPERR